MDLVAVDPQLNMYDEHWPIRTYQPNCPPPKFVFAERSSRRGVRPGQHRLPGQRSSPAARSSGRSSGRNVRINSYAHVEDSILFEGVDIGRHAKVRRAIIDKGVKIPGGVEIGYDRQLDAGRGFIVTDNGITVIAKADGFDRVFRRPSGQRRELE